MEAVNGNLNKQRRCEMRRRSVIVIAVMLALSLTLASTASAKEVSGTGTIWAKGVGQAVLRGDGEICYLLRA
jgi:hypothetical protein